MGAKLKGEASWPNAAACSRGTEKQNNADLPFGEASSHTLLWAFKSKSRHILRSLHWDPPVRLAREPLHPEQEIVEHWVVQVVN